MKLLLCFLFICVLSLQNLHAHQTFLIQSPNKLITLSFEVDRQGRALYSVSYHSQVVLKPSRLGLTTDGADFSQSLVFTSASTVTTIKDKYELYTGKKSIVNYTANKATVHLKNNAGKRLDIIFHVSNDGVAFRYFFPQQIENITTITGELTSFHFDTSAKAFLQPMQVSKSGWEKTNPAYEEHYKQGIAVTDTAATKAGWVYPVLFNFKNTWMLVTEAAVDSNYCATRLQTAAGGEYRVGFPDQKEVVRGGGLLPKLTPTFYSPWRIITVGSLKTIIESTLGTDLAKPSIAFDKSFIKPGKASWSWIMSKDDSIVYNEQIRYIDFASKMNWQYTLIDADWDRKIGYEKVAELSEYAATKKVGLLLWYNSAGDWNTVKYTPKNKLLTHENRMAEFTRIKTMGIKGVKIDFFGGDGQSVMQYYIEILNDAAKAGLMVNFHGATLPRGWHRTYPNLLTVEAVRGFEMITFNQADADAAANHCAILPFTRNAFDPMDFTPMNLYKIPTKSKRKTSSAFELATSVLFYSGLQHFAESPAGMEHVPDYVQQFLGELPVRWDDVKFIDGYPGKYIVLARKAGNRWYVAGINAEDSEKSIRFSLAPFKYERGLLITDGEEPLSFAKKIINPVEVTQQILLKPSGGFTMVLQQ